MVYIFGDCELDTDLYTLSRDGQTQQLQPRVYKLLMYLLEHRDHVVSKDELCEHVWPEQFITNSTLESAMRLVRQAVGDSGRNQRVIATARGHGYRFVADVVECPSMQAPEPLMTTTPSTTTPPTTTDPVHDPRPALGPSPFVGRQRELQ
ncbi:winged helix-turn-helix domain-containing protein [Candidatus Entotheonella palauensis]|uniref:winged helix-turn-helix domain-containing protein n=1 Tax=Candidatus Entotheonella palauensis TaxID=93172 RepID=UPI000B7D5475|nr:transcriptional regulator [Candidatus Entotheonella palauensis]